MSLGDSVKFLHSGICKLGLVVEEGTQDIDISAGSCFDTLFGTINYYYYSKLYIIYCFYISNQILFKRDSIRHKWNRKTVVVAVSE